MRYVEDRYRCALDAVEMYERGDHLVIRPALYPESEFPSRAECLEPLIIEKDKFKEHKQRGPGRILVDKKDSKDVYTNVYLRRVYRSGAETKKTHLVVLLRDWVQKYQWPLHKELHYVDIFVGIVLYVRPHFLNVPHQVHGTPRPRKPSLEELLRRLGEPEEEMIEMIRRADSDDH